MLNLTKNVTIDRVMNGVAAGTSEQTSSSIDMQDHEGVVFVAALGALTATAVTGIKVQQSADNSTWADLEDSALSIADDEDNGLLIAEVVKPVKRYVRCVVTRGTANAVIDGVIAIRTKPRVAPTTHGAGVIDSVLLISPDEGTA